MSQRPTPNVSDSATDMDAASETRRPDDEIEFLRREVSELKANLRELTGDGQQADPAPTRSSALVSSGMTVLEHATAQAETIAVRWMQAPAVIGVVLIIFGVGLVFFNLTSLDAGESVFWGGIVLIALGTVSATAVALMARPVADPSRSRNRLPEGRRLY